MTPQTLAPRVPQTILHGGQDAAPPDTAQLDTDEVVEQVRRILANPRRTRR